MPVKQFLFLLFIISVGIVRSLSAKDRSASPVKPVVDTSAIYVTHSCSDAATGSVLVKGIKSRGPIMGYYLVKGKKLSGDDCPDKVLYANKLRRGVLQPGDSILLQNLEEGDYILVVHHADISVGKTFFKHHIRIGKYQPLQLLKHEVTHVSCSYMADGKITATITGGNPGALEYTIIPNTGIVKKQGDKVIFSGLGKEVYDIYISDKCGRTVRAEQLHLKGEEPARGMLSVTAGVTPQATTLNVKLNKAANHQYALYKNADSVKAGSIATETFTVDGLDNGNYALSVVSSDNEACITRWDTLFVIADKKLLTEGVYNDRQHAYYNAQEKTSTYNTPLKQHVAFKKGDCYIVVEKSKYQLNVYNAKDELLFSYPVVFGNRDLGDKMCEGDRKTPEGTFYIQEKRVHDKWHKFLYIDYPNQDSYAKFNERKAKGLIAQNARIGGGIGLHGTWMNDDITIDRGDNWTLGCISTKNKYIDELFEIIPAGTKIIIRR